jgi:hypothetical protein
VGVGHDPNKTANTANVYLSQGIYYFTGKTGTATSDTTSTSSYYSNSTSLTYSNDETIEVANGGYFGSGLFDQLSWNGVFSVQ